MEAIVDRQVRQYQVSEYEKGQRATDYTTWLTSNVHYNAKFEEVRIMPPHSTFAALPGLLCDSLQRQGPFYLVAICTSLLLLKHAPCGVQISLIIFTDCEAWLGFLSVYDAVQHQDMMLLSDHHTVKFCMLFKFGSSCCCADC